MIIYGNPNSWYSIFTYAALKQLPMTVMLKTELPHFINTITNFYPQTVDENCAISADKTVICFNSVINAFILKDAPVNPTKNKTINISENRYRLVLNIDNIGDEPSYKFNRYITQINGKKVENFYIYKTFMATSLQKAEDVAQYMIKNENIFKNKRKKKRYANLITSTYNWIEPNPIVYGDNLTYQTVIIIDDFSVSAEKIKFAFDSFGCDNYLDRLSRDKLLFKTFTSFEEAKSFTDFCNMFQLLPDNNYCIKEAKIQLNLKIEVRI